MGAYLSEPKTAKESSDFDGEKLKCGASSMQGWRVSQEDAHNCILDFDKNASLFAVYDGHGGHEVAEYCSMKLPDFIKTTESYTQGEFVQALKDAFLGFDATLATPEVIEELKTIATGKDEDKRNSDGEGSESDEETLDNLVEEARMPLDEVMAKYKVGGPLARLKESKPPVSPMLRARRSASDAAGPSTSGTGAGSSKETDGEVSSSSSNGQETMGLCNGEAHVNGEVADYEEKSEAEVKVNNSDEAVKKVKMSTIDSDVEQSVSIIMNKHDESGCKEEVSRTEADSSGITISVSSSSDASDASDEISSSSPPKKKKSSLEIYQQLLQEDSDSEEEDETFTADAESEDASSDEVNDKDCDDDNDDESSLDDEEDEEEDEVYPDIGKEEPGIDSGCTAVVALLVDSDLYVANAGDSRCVLCRDGQAVEMSVDHKPEDETEKERIENAGGKVTCDGRVNGGLNLSRAIGDHSYKQVALLPPQKQMITALPDVRQITLEPGKDEFMVLACDGIWNSMTSQEVVDFVRAKLSQGIERLSQICEELFDHCLAPNTKGDGTGCDNMTTVIVQFKSCKRPAESNQPEEPSSKRIKIDDEVSQTQ